MNAEWRYVHVLCQIPNLFIHFYEECSRAPFFKIFDYEIVVFIQIQCVWKVMLVGYGM
jgi:hypothetical protein